MAFSIVLLFMTLVWPKATRLEGHSRLHEPRRGLERPSNRRAWARLLKARETITTAPGVALPEARSRVLQHEMADRSVRRRNMVESVRHPRLRAAGDIRHRAARDQPHHKLNAFRTRLADIFDVRHLREVLGVVDQLVEEHVVPLPVDQAGARALELMAHAASAPNMDVQILGVTLDRLADRLAEGEAARPR